MCAGCYRSGCSFRLSLPFDKLSSSVLCWATFPGCSAEWPLKFLTLSSVPLLVSLDAPLLVPFSGLRLRLCLGFYSANHEAAT